MLAPTLPPLRRPPPLRPTVTLPAPNPHPRRLSAAVNAYRICDTFSDMRAEPADDENSGLVSGGGGGGGFGGDGRTRPDYVAMAAEAAERHTAESAEPGDSTHYRAI